MMVVACPAIPVAPMIPMIMVAVPVVPFPTAMERNIIILPIVPPVVSNLVGGSEAVAILPMSGLIAEVANFAFDSP